MNVYVMVDMEGICGIAMRDQVMPASARYSEGRALMTRDVNICAEALKEAGVEKVYVRDAHSAGTNIFWDKLSPAIDYFVMGSTSEKRFPGIEDCDAVILLGYHAMAGTLGGILEHSMSSASVQNYWINGEKAGETAIDAGIVGDLGKPVIMVSGDDKLCAEAKALLPWVTACQVKWGITTFGGMLLPPVQAEKLLREKTVEAVQNAKNCKPLVYPSPVTFRVEVMERIPLPNIYAKPQVKIIDGRTYEVTAETVTQAFWQIH